MKHTILSIIFLIVLNFFSNSSFSQTNVPGGTVSGAWTKAASPYLIQGPIMVEDGQTLSIEPGVRVEFQGAYKFLILGRLMAIGTQTDTIVFTATNITNGWKGIRFDFTPSTNDTTKIMYCKIQYGRASGTGSDVYGGGLYFINFSKAVIANSSILNCTASGGNGGGIYLWRSKPVIKNNTIKNNTANLGGGIYCYDGGTIISNNIISNNEGGGIFCWAGIISNNIISNNMGGGIITADASVISNNIISNNTAYDGGGIFAEDSPIILNNIISNNTAILQGGGVSFIRASGPMVILNSIISNNTAPSGAGVYCKSRRLTISNSVISNNYASNSGGGIFCVNTVDPTIINSILWGNTSNISGAQVFLEDEVSDPTFKYCDIQGGKAAFETNGNFYLGTYQNNIDANPLFVSPSGGDGIGFNGVAADWSLQSNSPCINAGDTSGTYPTINYNNDIVWLNYPKTDVTGNPRVSGGLMDIGAYEYQGTVTGIRQNNHSEEGINIYPNPSNGTFKIEMNNSFEGIATVSVINVLGESIYTEEQLINNSLSHPIALKGIMEGIYIVKVQTGKEVISKRMLIK